MSAERQQLLWLGVGLGVIGTALSWWSGGLRPFPVVLLGLAALALVGAAVQGATGRGVFLLFSLVTRAIGAVVSWIVVLGVYVVTIGVLGSILKLFGMNRLSRNFEECKKRQTMLVDVPPLDEASFRRQS